MVVVIFASELGEAAEMVSAALVRLEAAMSERQSVAPRE